MHNNDSYVHTIKTIVCNIANISFNSEEKTLIEEIVGRAKKPAKRRNYKITFDVLARLSAISRLEDRSDTAQLERFIKEGSERWESENLGKSEEYRRLIAEIQAELESED
jgi:hypothetical protein